MKLKSQSPEWMVAIVHYMIFTVVVLIFNVVGFPLLFGHLLGVSMLALGRIDYGAAYVLSLTLKILSIGIGVWISSFCVNKLYIINRSKRVVILATIYFVVINGAFDWYSRQNPFSLIANLSLFRTFSDKVIVAFILSIVVFYLLSNLCIRSVQQVKNS
jgi:hypothetical protein